jgi:hypothetical protein
MSDLVGFGLATSAAAATISIAGGATIEAKGGDVAARAWAVGNAKLFLAVGGTYLAGVLRGLSGIKYAFGVSISDVSATATVTQAATSTIKATGSVDILAMAVKNVGHTSEVEGEYKKLAVNFALATAVTTATLDISGTIIAAGDVRLATISSTVQGQVETVAGVGTPTSSFAGRFRQAMSNVPRLTRGKGNGRLSRLQGRLADKIIPAKYSNLKSAFSPDDGKAADKAKKWGVTIAVGVVDFDGTATTTVRQGATITSGSLLATDPGGQPAWGSAGSVVVIAQAVERQAFKELL